MEELMNEIIVAYSKLNNDISELRKQMTNLISIADKTKLQMDRDKAYYIAHREQKLQKAKERYKQKKSECIAYTKEWQKKNPEKKKEYQRRYYEKQKRIKNGEVV